MDPKPTIQIDDVLKLDLRVGTITTAEPHPNADRLLRLQVDLGDHQRQICAGIKQFYEPENLVGKQIVVVANLPPRKMRGLESQGMLLAACSDDRQALALVTLDRSIAAGTRVS